ncbi:MAG: hypothetical protein ACR2GO_06370 [Candidatus Limnocylindria bacterium]
MPDMHAPSQRIRRRNWRAPILGLLITLPACLAAPGASEPANSTDDRPFRSAGPIATVPDQSTIPSTGEVPAEVLANVLADAMERSGLDASAIDTLRAESVTWPDGSLGCPEPGVMYTMALVEGYQVVLQAGEEELDYRIGESGSFRLCEQGGRPAG